ncbi:Hypothetical predicted protein [Cloeon dipterum]|uniref:Uncharacterized protein n=1 Tax=Cloeon dipterum TaxID=197152 RepID=A0A8S1DWD8_9INSE|nr:Hypothetical predicted protein [Cloeon dipterum]
MGFRVKPAFVLLALCVVCLLQTTKGKDDGDDEENMGLVSGGEKVGARPAPMMESAAANKKNNNINNKGQKKPQQQQGAKTAQKTKARNSAGTNKGGSVQQKNKLKSKKSQNAKQKRQGTDQYSDPSYDYANDNAYDYGSVGGGGGGGGGAGSGHGGRGGPGKHGGKGPNTHPVSDSNGHQQSCPASLQAIYCIFTSGANIMVFWMKETFIFLALLVVCLTKATADVNDDGGEEKTEVVSGAEKVDARPAPVMANAAARSKNNQNLSGRQGRKQQGKNANYQNQAARSGANQKGKRNGKQTNSKNNKSMVLLGAENTIMKLIVFLAVLCALTFVVLAQNNNNKGKKNKGGKQDGGGKINKGGKQAQSNKKDQKNEAQKKAAKHFGKSGGSARFGYYAAYDDYGRDDEEYLAQSPDEYGDERGGHDGSSSEEPVSVYDDMNYDDGDCDGFNYYSNGPQMMWAFFFPIAMMPGYSPYGGGYMMSPYGSPILAVMPPPFGRPPVPPPMAYGRFDDEYDYGSQKKIKSGNVGKSDLKKKNPASAKEQKKKPTPTPTSTTPKKAAKKNNGKKG